MKLARNFAAAAALAATLAAPLPTLAATTLIDFEGAGSFASIADFYNGGTDGNGNSGSAVGVSFSGAALALSNDVLGPYFSHAPTPGSVMFASDASAVMNVASGFAGELSFFYSALTSAFDVVTIYSGLNATGSVLGAVSLSSNAQLGGCTDSPLCNWQRVALSFAGTGKSVSFGGNAGNVAFDNVAITAVPEASTYAMLALGLAGVMLAARRQRRG